MTVRVTRAKPVAAAARCERDEAVDPCGKPAAATIWPPVDMLSEPWYACSEHAQEIVDANARAAPKIGVRWAVIPRALMKKADPRRGPPETRIQRKP